MPTRYCALLLLAASLGSAAELVLPGESFERDAPVTAVFRTGLPTTGAGTLAVEWTDVLGRVVERRTIPIVLTDENEIRFTIDLRRAVAMVNRLHAHLSLAGRNLKGGDDKREEDADAEFVARPASRSWDDYQIMMWQSYGAGQTAHLLPLGINAGQYNGRNRTLPEFLLKNDMRWYAENLATDFYSEYHRFRSDRIQNWSWLQARELLKKNPDSLEPFKRHPSFSDPAWLDRVRTNLAAMAKRWSPYRPIFYDLADESGIADLASFWDFDFSDESLDGMRQWLRERYGTLDALNRQWGTEFTSWNLVMPETTRQAMRRSDDNYSSWADFKEWMDIPYARALQTGVDAIHSVDPHAYVAIAGAQMPGWGGYDYYRLSRVLTAIEPYDIGSNIEMLRSFNPGLPFVTTAFARGPWEKHRIWFQLLHGAHGNIIWDEKSEHVTPSGDIGPRGQEVSPYYNEIRSGIGSLLIHSVRQSDPVAIHYSQPSMRTEWMLAQRSKGDAWTERTSSTERMDSDFLKVRESYCRMIEDLGLQYNFVAYTQVEEGELSRGGYRVLILPHSSALSDREIDAIREFVAGGGLVVADGEPGTFDEHSRRRATPALADLFASGGVVRMDALPYYQLRLMGKESALLEQAKALVDSRAVAAPIAVHDDRGGPAVGVETHRFRNGGVTIVGLLSNPQQRVNELGPPEFKSNQRFEKPAALQVVLPAESYVYDVRAGTALGRKRNLAFTVDPYEPRILAFTDAPLPKLHLTVPAAIDRGSSLKIVFAFDADPPAATSVVHVELVDPSGAPALHYSANVAFSGRSGADVVPLALNDSAGRWTIRVKDVLTGQVQSSALDVR